MFGASTTPQRESLRAILLRRRSTMQVASDAVRTDIEPCVEMVTFKKASTAKYIKRSAEIWQMPFLFEKHWSGKDRT